MVRVFRQKDLRKMCLESVHGIQLETRTNLQGKAAILIKRAQVKDEEGSLIQSQHLPPEIDFNIVVSNLKPGPKTTQANVYYIKIGRVHAMQIKVNFVSGDNSEDWRWSPTLLYQPQLGMGRQQTLNSEQYGLLLEIPSASAARRLRSKYSLLI